MSAARSVPIALVGNKLDLDNKFDRAVSTEEANDAASSRHCAFAETSAKTCDVGQTVNSVLGQLLMRGFGDQLIASSSANSGRSGESIKTSGKGSLKGTPRGLSGKKRLDRSRSVGIMSVPVEHIETTSENNIQQRHLANDVKLPTRVTVQRRISNSQTSLSPNFEELPDSRCVIA